MDSRQEIKSMAVVFAMALAVRLACLWQYQHSPTFYLPVGDSITYFMQAMRILEGGKWFPDAVPFQSPLYSWFLVVVFKIFGVHLFTLLLVQIVMGSASCVLIYSLARKVRPSEPHVALWAGSLAAFYGVLAFFDCEILMTSLVVFLILLFMLMLLRWLDTGR
ncbi:glycosyltransferase family 39 protein, partial [candidate division FCPU426 bacterium]|nr:glycosyltransferase family 39 protein [candidate division FCPU426 bacterium]